MTISRARSWTECLTCMSWCGVSQRCVLGPLLFVLNTKDGHCHRTTTTVQMTPGHHQHLPIIMSMRFPVALTTYCALFLIQKFCVLFFIPSFHPGWTTETHHAHYLLPALPVCDIQCLQSMQNAAARLIGGLKTLQCLSGSTWSSLVANRSMLQFQDWSFDVQGWERAVIAIS